MGLVSSKGRDMKLTALVFIPALSIICKEWGGGALQIREGGTKESSVTAECKHDGVETSGFASVGFINGVTPFFAGWC